MPGYRVGIGHAVHRMQATMRRVVRQDRCGLVVIGDQAGANGFVAKPFVAPSLCEKVLRLVASLPPVSEFVQPSALSVGARP